jgi:hypothetical protein
MPAVLLAPPGMVKQARAEENLTLALRQMVAERLGVAVERVSSDARPTQLLSIDQLHLLTLDVEQAFDFDIETTDQLHTLADWVALVRASGWCNNVA